MSDPAYNQRLASDPERSIWVSASAGSGKTKVLTDRVLRLLLSGAAPSRILCLTYTRAASAEMEHRLREALGKWAICEEGELRASLHALVGHPPEAQTIERARGLFVQVIDSALPMPIETMHGFCQSILKRFPLEANLPPHFSLIDERTAEELLHAAKTRLMREAGAHPGGDPEPDARRALLELTARMPESSFDALLGMILKERARFIPWLEALPKHVSAGAQLLASFGLSPESEETHCIGPLFRRAEPERARLTKALLTLERIGGKINLATARALLILLEGQEVMLEDYLRAFLTAEGAPRKKLCTNDALKDTPFLADLLLEEQAKALSLQDSLGGFRLARASASVASLAEVLFGIYEREKRLRHYLDYDDLIDRTLALLKQEGVAPWVLYKIEGGIDHILIDEAQDTSARQWELVQALTTEFFAGEGSAHAPRTLFVVGDEKQSIFSFQGADARLFHEKQMETKRRSHQARLAFDNVRLDLSFRSTAPVLQAVDGVFRQEEARIGLVFGESVIKHEAYRVGQGGLVEIWPLCQTPEEEEMPAWSPARMTRGMRPERLAAKEIAEKIKKWLDQGEILAAKGRPVRPGDIMILVQKRGLFASDMLRALKQLGVRAAGADRLRLTDHIAVQDCLALADFLLMPQDDLTLAVLLRSPFLGLSEEEVFDLAFERGGMTLWDRLQADERHEAASRFLANLLRIVDYLPPYELLTRVLDTLEGRKKLAGRLGDEIHDPLDELLSAALEYDRAHPPSLQGFLAWLRGSESEIKRDMEKGRDEVRILTVHAAKGLQAPIVFLGDAARLPGRGPNRLQEIFWEEGGLPLWAPPSGGPPPARYADLRLARKRQDAEEYRRLLYVAMTRAEDRLYVCGWQPKKNASDAMRSWHDLILGAAEAEEGWQKNEEGVWRLHTPQEATLPAMPSVMPPPAPLILPAWARSLPPAEGKTLRVIAPSHMEEGNAARIARDPKAHDPKARERGILIHRLLQYLPFLPEDLREAQARVMAGAEGQEAAEEVLRLLADPVFRPVFSGDALVEAPVSGRLEIDGETVLVSGRIDRLLVSPEEIYIIDYKTGRPPGDAASLPLADLRQMRAYALLMQRIYPGRRLRAALLWTAAPRLTLLTPEMLAGGF